MLARNSFVPRMTLVDVVGFFFPDCYSRVFVFSGRWKLLWRSSVPFSRTFISRKKSFKNQHSDSLSLLTYGEWGEKF